MGAAKLIRIRVVASWLLLVGLFIFLKIGYLEVVIFVISPALYLVRFLKPALRPSRMSDNRLLVVFLATFVVMGVLRYWRHTLDADGTGAMIITGVLYSMIAVMIAWAVYGDIQLFHQPATEQKV